jgi:ATP-dependent RNA helicase RhlE
MNREEMDRPNGFGGLGIAPNLLSALDALKFKSPTPIQAKAIPPGIEGQDLIGIAQTGTGKTLAFCVPMLQRISALKCQGLVLLPTRELALQVNETFEKVGKRFGLRTAVLIGGASMNVQKQMINKRPHVVIATPGRLIDHMQQRSIDLQRIGILVLDEADRMLDMGFAPQINRILEKVPKERQTLLFSATMPQEISRMASKYMKLPLRVEVARAGTAAEKVSQELYVVKKEDKTRLLEQILSSERGSVLVFSRTKHGAKKITRTVKDMGHSAAELHSNRSLNQRKEALEGFKSGRYRVLVATDIAARGIDVVGIELVINFDLPDQAEDYVHRIGRTGRAGRTGKAISFATPDQGRDVRDIEKLVRVQLPITKLPELPPHRATPRMERSFDRPRQGGGGRPFRGGGGSRPHRGGSRSHGGHGGHRGGGGGQRGGGGGGGQRRGAPKREYYGGAGV